MAKFSLDYNQLSAAVNYTQKQVFKLADVKHKLEKVGFDVFRMKDGNPDELWQIQSADDGEYIVAKYESDENKQDITASKWDVLVSESSGDINIFYNGHPITKFAATKLGVNSDDFGTLRRFLPGKLATDKNFVKALLATLDDVSKAAILKLYPELF
jgi:hypothetical protein